MCLEVPFNMNPSLPSSMQDEADKMKGDAIGDTMYSERWVLKTLMKLSEKYVEYTSSDDYHLESDLEGDLGLLWDMTIEPDVAKFLMEHDALDLIVDIVKFSCSPRLTEIMIGILGNLACEESVRQKIDTNEGLIKVIINLLNFTDSPTLVQLVRLLTTCIWDVGKKAKRGVKLAEGDSAVEDVAMKEVTSPWIKCLREESELVFHSVNFILASSRNEDLLTATLGLLESLFNLTWYDNDYFCKQFSTEDCIKALVEALKEVTSHTEDVADSYLNHRRLREACGHWVTVLHRMTYHGLGMNALGKHADTVFDLVSSLWVDQLASGGHLRSSALHITLALELLEALLPLSSHHCGIGNVLELLGAPPEDWEGGEEGNTNGLRRTLEDFCMSVARQWTLRDVDVERELRTLKGQQLTVLEGLLAKRVCAVSSSAHDDSQDVKLIEIKRIIQEIKVDH